MLDVLNEVKAVAERHSVTPGQVGLAWLLAQGDDIIPIPGTRSIKVVHRLSRINLNSANTWTVSGTERRGRECQANPRGMRNHTKGFSCQWCPRGPTLYRVPYGNDKCGFAITQRSVDGCVPGFWNYLVRDLALKVMNFSHVFVYRSRHTIQLDACEICKLKIFSVCSTRNQECVPTSNNSSSNPPKPRPPGMFFGCYGFRTGSAWR